MLLSPNLLVLSNKHSLTTCRVGIAKQVPQRVYTRAATSTKYDNIIYNQALPAYIPDSCYQPCPVEVPSPAEVPDP